MRNRILFMGSIIFASHVAFGEILVALPRPAEVVRQLSLSFEQEIAGELTARGLEASAAKALSQNSVVNGSDAMLLTYMLTTKLGIDRQQVYSHIASQALFQKKVDLRAYGDVVAMVQKIKGVAMAQRDLNAIEEYVAIV